MVSLDLQVKRAFAFKANESNGDFFDIVARASQTLGASTFRTGIDRIGVATDEIDASHLRQVRTVCEWARDSLNPADFLRRIDTQGVSSKAKQAVVAAAREGLTRALGRPADVSDIHRFLSHFVLLRFDLLDEAAADQDLVLDRLSRVLVTDQPGAALEVWRSLRTIARDIAGRAGGLDRETLRLRLGTPERFSITHRLAADVERLVAEAQLAFSTIERDIDGLQIARPSLVEAIGVGLVTHRLVQIVGQPGAGKSVLLRMAAEGAVHEPLIGLRSDRIEAGGWPAYARALGLTHATPLPVLREMACAGDPILFIDGLDRVVGVARTLVQELVGLILEDPTLARWRIVATLRDGAWEQVRRWLPALKATLSHAVEVKGLSDAEAEIVAADRPRLRELLFGPNDVQEIARRPFFLGVLASAIDLDAQTPSSETELIGAWWAGGGYAAEGPERARRQEALVALAKHSAANLGRKARIRGLDHEAVESLKADRILVDVEQGHTVSFAHDIFFEWAFTHLLIDAEAGWREELVNAGEPPALGRPVELLSQRCFEQDQAWENELALLEAGQTRSQWRRAWLIAPLSSPRFWTQSAAFSKALVGGEDWGRLEHLLTWFQAVRSQPSHRDWHALLGDLSEADIVRLADNLAIPDDLSTWTRFLYWLLQEQIYIPPRLWPSVLTCAEVWQRAFPRSRTNVTESLLTLAGDWLAIIEEKRRGATWDRKRSPGDLDYDQEKELAQSLRGFIFGAAVVFPQHTQTYLERLLAEEHASHDAIASVVSMSAFVARADAQRLSALVLKLAVELLPRAQMQREADDDAAARAKALEYPEGSRERDLLMPSGLGGWINSWDWDHLSVHGLDQHIQIPSPIAEPFHALFAVNPDLALKTVKALCDHAVAAWRELHELDPDEGDGTPLPLELDLPWGRQTFWGAEREYLLYRGVFSPQIITASLMVLEGWALAELDAGADLDALLHRILEGCQHNALLGIASTLALSRPTASAATLPLVTAQRLWHWDIGRLARVDSTGAPANEITAMGRRRELVALKAANGRPERRLWIGSLAGLFLLNAEPEVGAAFKAAVAKFGDDAALDFAEQAEDEAWVAERKRQGARWSAFGDPEAYSIEPVEGGVQIEARQPDSTDEADIRQVQELKDTQRWIALAMWAARALGEAVESVGLSDEVAIAEAQALDAPDLFEDRDQFGGLEELRRAGVAGAAAFVLRETRYQDEPLLAWAQDVTMRAYGTPLSGDGMTFAESILSHHPLKFVPIGLAGIIRRGRPVESVGYGLLNMVRCFVNEVSVAAARAAYSLADVEPRVAAAALRLVVALGIRSDAPLARRRDRNRADGIRQAAADAAFEAALAVASGKAAFGLPELPISHDDLEEADDGKPDDEAWLDTTFLTAHLEGLVAPPPGLDEAVNTLADGLLRWTLSRASDDERRGRSSLIVWRGQLMRWMAWRARPWPAEQVIALIVDPIAAEEDAACLQLLEPFIGIYAAALMHEADEIAPATMTVMLAAARRVAAMGPASRHAYGSDTRQLLRDVMCVPHIRTTGARRFANGEWRDVPVLWPIIDILLPALKRRSDFAQIWLSLLEHAHAHYPIARFAAEASLILDALPAKQAKESGFLIRLGPILQTLLDRGDPLESATRERLLRILDVLTDAGDRRAAQLQRSEHFRTVAREA
ncbi:hypothetical protein [Caulobacter sp.]|uniref:hypothetical protein n=1 Tax=Caulobacter sp. TaxID=78 RepID=UPI003BAABBD4